MAGELGQFEVRYAYNQNWAPFAFYDIGHVKFEKQPVVAGSVNTQTLSGVGVGLRYQEGPMGLEFVLSNSGTGKSQTDLGHKSNTIWFNVRYSF